MDIQFLDFLGILILGFLTIRPGRGAAYLSCRVMSSSLCLVAYEGGLNLMIAQVTDIGIFILQTNVVQKLSFLYPAICSLIYTENFSDKTDLICFCSAMLFFRFKRLCFKSHLI